MKRFQNYFERHFIPALIMIVLGIMLLSRPGYMIKSGAKLLGIAMVISGAVAIAMSRGLGRYAGGATIVGGAAAILAGLVLFARSRTFLTIFPTAAGLLIIVNGFLSLSGSYKEGRSGIRSWLLTAVLSLVAIGFGLYIFLHPFRTVEMAARIIGVMFIYEGVLEMVVKSRYHSL